VSKFTLQIYTDKATIGNFRQATDTGYGHNVIVHGSRPDYDSLGGVFYTTRKYANKRGKDVYDTRHTHSQQIIDAVKSNPNYKPGSPVCLASCWSGSNRTAQQVADGLKATVNAPTRPVRFNKHTKQWEQMSDREMIRRGHEDLLHNKPEIKTFNPK